MRTFLFICALVGLTLWGISLQRRLQAATMRGDMYRDISARLDRRVAELGASDTSA